MQIRSRAILLVLAALLFFGCAAQGESANSTDHSPAPDDDSAPPDDDASPVGDDDNDNDNNAATPVDPYEQWCINLGTLPPEAGWKWSQRLVGVQPPPIDLRYQFVTFAGEALYVLWTFNDSGVNRSNSWLGRWDGEDWTQWDLGGATGPRFLFLGLATDSAGGVWSLLFDGWHDIYPTSCNLVRWEDGEIAELRPVMETNPAWLQKLWMTPDDRITFLYYDEGYSWALVEETPDGDFAKLRDPDCGLAGLGPDGLLYTLTAEDPPDPGIILTRGSAITGFVRKAVGEAPMRFGYAFGAANTAVDSEGRAYTSRDLRDARLWLAAYDGAQLTFEPWSDRSVWGMQAATAMGVGGNGRPFVVLTGTALDWGDNCMMMMTPAGVRGEFIGVTAGTPTWWDVATSAGGAIAAAGDFSAAEDCIEIQVFVRQPRADGRGQ